MAKSFFGTDGIRGTVNTESLNSEIALKLGLAAGAPGPDLSEWQWQQ